MDRQELLQFEVAKAVDGISRMTGDNRHFGDFYRGLVFAGINDEDPRFAPFAEIRATMKRAMVVPNAIAKALRDKPRRATFPTPAELAATNPVVKSVLDVGSLTNFASITGGQSLGYVSLDTQLARGTVRPNSFTMYQCLHKTAAYQIVDYWAYNSDNGGGLPGTAFQSFGNVSSGTLSTNAGTYTLQNVTLALATDGRAMTTALAAQNSFVDIAQQETVNASLNILTSIDWTCYWGDNTLYTTQFNGLAKQIPAANVYDYQDFANKYQTNYGWSAAQTLYNLIYEASAQITSFRQFGRITHAFMSPVTAGALQGLVTTLLNNIVTQITPSQERLTGIVVDGDLQGMRTRFGEIQFPIDLFINARDKPAQAILKDDGTNYATTVTPTRPISVTAVVSGVNAASGQWSAAYVAASGAYSYAVASTDGSSNESLLTYISSGAGSVSGLGVTGIVVSGAVTLTIAAPGAADATAYRVYRSGLGYASGITTSGSLNPAAYRYIGTVAANGASNVTFIDYNQTIPGSENIFLLDMDENDYAVDFRYLLPLTRVELFAQNLYMPWAVCMIGSLRLRVPKFHGRIKNAVVDNPNFNPLTPNANAT
jgi:hypothetical protein